MKASEIKVGTHYMVGGAKGKVLEIDRTFRPIVKVSFRNNRSHLGRSIAWFQPREVRPIRTRK